jgi:cytoskeleton-associated protein 5
VGAAAGAEELWKMLGRLEPREKEVIEERLRRSARAAAPAQATTMPDATPSPEQAAPGAGAERDGYGGAPLAYSRPAFTPPNALDMTPLPSRPPPAADDSSPVLGGRGAPLVPTPVPSGAPHSPSPAWAAAAAAAPAAAYAQEDPEFERRWAANLAAVESGPLPAAVDAMKQLCADIMVAADPAGGAPPRVRAVMGDSAARLFAGVHRQLGAIFAAAEAEEAATGAPPSSRGCKYALNVMLQGMGVREVALGLPQATLRDAVSLLLLRLLEDGGLLRFDEGPTLVRAVNVLMLKMLEASNRTYAFAALLRLLRDPPQGVPPAAVPRFNDLVVRCLIKLTKSLQASAQGVDLPSLLLSLHDFFMSLGVDEIRRRSSADDKPLRMVKTVLHELCKLEGRRVYAHAAGIPGRHANPQPIIFAYIQLNLSSLEQSGLLAGDEGGAEADAQAAGEARARAEAEAAAAAAPAAAAAEVQAQAQKAVRRCCGEGVCTLPPRGRFLPVCCAPADALPPLPFRVPRASQEVKQRLKDIMTHLVQRDAALQEAAMVGLYRLKW